MTGAASTRLHYLDTMRGMLMLLGVVLHSARPYIGEPWRVKDPEAVPALDALVDAIFLFRMPAFFVIAGFFAMYLVERRPTVAFLRDRMQRVLVPLVVMLFSVNLAQLWFLAVHAGTATGGFVSGVLLPALRDGDLSSHLWFLACLAIYFALTAAVAPNLRALAAAARSDAGGRVGSVAYALVLTAAVVAPVAIAAVGKLTAPLLGRFVLGLVSISTVLDYLPYFIVGVLLGMNPRFLDRFARIDGLVAALAVCGGIGMYLAAGREQVEWRALSIVSWSLLAWMAVRAVFALFRRHADRPTRVFRYLSDASYSVYLFHHIVVIMVATWLLEVDISAWLKFPIVLAVASLTSLGVYHFLIRRHRVLQLLFNGAVRATPMAAPVEGTRPARGRLTTARNGVAGR